MVEADAKFRLTLSVEISDPKRWQSSWSELNRLVPMFLDASSVSITSELLDYPELGEDEDEEMLAKLAVLLRENCFFEEAIEKILSAIQANGMKIKGR